MKFWSALSVLLHGAVVTAVSPANNSENDLVRRATSFWYANSMYHPSDLLGCLDTNDLKWTTRAMPGGLLPTCLEEISATKSSSQPHQVMDPPSSVQSMLEAMVALVTVSGLPASRG